MRRLALPLSLIAVACGDDVSPQATDTDEPGSSSSTSPSTLGNESSSSESSAAVESSTSTDATVDPTTESSSTDPLVDPESSSGEAPAVCGDGLISGEEMCEPGDFAGNTCQSQGFQSGVLTCSGDCLGFSTSQCFICGDAKIEGTEECDGPLDNDMDCEALGFTTGPISCDMSTCQLDVSGCTFCGDGVAEGTEFCDISDLFGESCESLGFSGGQLGCHPETCGFDYTDCQGGQYIQDFESCDIPPEFTFTLATEWVADATSPITGSCSAHNLDISDGQEVGMQLTTVWAIEGTASFTRRTDSESNFDYLRFYVDGVQIQQWSGPGGAVGTESFPISPGNHTLEWRYRKDGSVTTGTDTVWVDDIVLFGGVPI